MDKQKQIDGMARIIAFDLCPNRHVHAKWGKEAQCYSDNNFAECTKIKNVVDKLYNAGYRKIPENAVVLTMEDLADMKFTQEHCNLYMENKWLKECIPLARKETAEKFAERLIEEADKNRDNIRNRVVSICDIENVCKEITEGKV